MWRCFRRRESWPPWESPLSFLSFSMLPYRHLQKFSYVNGKTKWKKDATLDCIAVVNRSRDIRIISSLKNIMMAAPGSDHAIPVSTVSKMDRILEVPTKVISFLRRYPSFFEEFVGPQYNLPWFKPTPEAIALHREENVVFEVRRREIVDNVRKLMLMSTEKRLPIQIVQGMQWYLGLPEDFTKKAVEYSEGTLRLVEMGDGVLGLATVDCGERVLSALQRNAVKKMGASEGVESPPVIEFPLFPSKGFRLKQKVIDWLGEFQRLPYVSPYEDSSDLHPNSRLAEKRLAGLLHELLSLFVDNSAERRKILCLRRHLGLSQRFYRAFEHHPHIFYLLLKNKTCTVVLKEAYCGATNSSNEKHPVLEIRKKYVELMVKSDINLKERRRRAMVNTREDYSEDDHDKPIERYDDGSPHICDKAEESLVD